jgi:DNA-binding NtrC family response regulator
MNDLDTSPSLPCFDDLFLGSSASMERLRLQAARVAPHFRIALITGEAGSGKKRLGVELHKLSLSPDGAYLFRTAAEFVDDRLEAAHDNLASTLFLSRVDQLTLPQQDQLLVRLNTSSFPGRRRVFDSRTVIERVILASDLDLRGMVSAGRMGVAFFNRIGTLEMRLPALRERIEDLEALATGMLCQMGSTARLGESAIEALKRHAWPGNLRELRAALEQIHHLPGEVEAEDLPRLWTRATDTRLLRLDDVMQRHVVDVLQRCAGNKLRAAELLGIRRSTLYRMLDQLAA